MKRLGFSLALLWCLAPLFAFAAPYSAPPGTGETQVEFSARDAVLRLDRSLTPYHGPSGGQAGCSDWYMVSAVNDSVRPSTRVLQAGQSAATALRIFPASTRPQIGEVASSDAGVFVERAGAYGRRAFRVTIPPATPVALALCFSNAESPPSLLAWTEPALAQHNRSLAIFIAAVAGLIGAAMIIAAGLAAVSGHEPPRWAALTLFLVLLTRLSATGMFDASLVTTIGGPYGLTAMLAGLSLTAGAMFVNSLEPVREMWPRYRSITRWTLIGLVAISVFAYLGVPAATILTDLAVLIGTPLAAAYVVLRGQAGSRVARVTAPCAVVFALVVVAAAATRLGGFGDNLVVGDVAGGFAAAGSLLLTLAVAADEGILARPVARFIGAAATLKSASEVVGVARPRAGELDAIAASHQGVFDLDLRDDVLTLSQEALAMLGLDDADARLPHDRWLSAIHAEDRDLYVQALDDYGTHPGIAFRVEFRILSEARRYHWIELRATMIGAGVKSSRCLGLMADVSGRKETEAAQSGRALHDSLTGLGNRLALMEELECAGQALRQSILVLLDLDRFKSIHASVGDSGGDKVLSEIATRLSSRFKDTAHAFRVGGDAFAMVFTDGDPEAIGKELVETCNEPVLSDGRNIFATASVGVATGALAEDPLELIKNAELALIQAKRQGGACARLYGPELEALAPGDAVVLEAELRRALEEKQLDVFYQPIVRLADGSVAGFEALLRWHHPVRGIVPPSDFIAHAEETGLIVALGRYALERATHELSNWQRFFPLTPALFVSVNVSRRQLRDPDFEADVTRFIAEHDIRPGTLKLEITETAIATDANAHEMLKRLRSLSGAGLSIDDFGTGQSSLSQLRELPFDTVKIDKSFLARHGGTHEDVEGAVVLSSIVSLAHDLKRSVVVEGVENVRDAQWLRSIGCEFAQGFYYSVPLPANEALEYIARNYDPAAAVAPPPLASKG